MLLSIHDIGSIYENHTLRMHKPSVSTLAATCGLTDHLYNLKKRLKTL